MTATQSDKPHARLITVQGEARSGKGTLARAIVEDLSRDHRVSYVDQGLKFRVIADTYLKQGGDIENIAAIGDFLVSDAGYNAVLTRLALVATMAKPEIEEFFYTSQINNASGMVGKSETAQQKALALLHDEVKALAGDNEIVVLDGRAMWEKGNQFKNEGLVDFPLAFDVTCDPMTAARRLTGIFEPNIDNLAQQDVVKLLRTVNDINKRNSADRRRAVYPSLPISGAVVFDVTHDHTDEEFADACRKVAEVGAVSVDNSHTRSIEQFTSPVLKLVRSVLSR